MPAPQAALNRLTWAKLWMGMTPGTNSASMPATSSASRNRSSRSVSKQYWVISRTAPASTLRFTFSKSANALGASGWTSG